MSQKTYVNGGYAAMFDAKLFLNHLDNGRQTIGRAGRVGNDFNVFVIGEEFLMIAS